MYTLTCASQPSWTAILKANVSSFFQTALLISADPKTAEAGVVAAVNDLNVLLRANEDIGEMHAAIARKTIARLASQESVDTLQAQSMLQPGLWPLLQVEQCPRICFVLRVLLGCAMSSCAQILGVEQADVRALLQVALLQLGHLKK